MKTEPDTMRFRLCSLLKYLGGRGKLRFLRTEMFFQNIPVLRSAYFPKKLFSFFSKTLDLQVRFAHPPNGEASHRHTLRRAGVPAGLFDFSASFRFTVHPCEEVKTLGLQVCFAHPPNGEALPRPLRFSKYTSALFYSVYGTLR